MLLDLFNQRADTALANPIPDLPRTESERFLLDFKAARAPDRSGFFEQSMFERFEQAREQFFRLTGRRLPNPMAVRTGTESLAGAIRGQGETPADAFRRSLTEFQDAFREERKKRPDLGIPDPFLFEAQIAEEAERLRENAARAGNVSVGLGGVAAFLGAAGGELTHPLQLLTLPLALPEGVAMSAGRGAIAAALARIGRTAVSEGVVAGGTETVVQGLDFVSRSRLGTEQTPEEALASILIATGGGAIFGAGVRAVAETGKAVIGRATRSERAAIDQLDRAAMTESANPLGSARANEHVATVTRADEAVRAGRHAEAPQTRLDPSEAIIPPRRVFTPGGRAVDVAFEVVEADTLIASHGPDLQRNRAFPEDLQPRERARAASESQIAEMASRLEPERLGPSSDATTGAPIVGPDNVVESGNARVIATQRAFLEGRTGADAMRRFLTEQGFDVSGFRQPVLIARRTTGLSPEERVAFAREANQSNVLTQGQAEQAMADAALLDNVIGRVEPGGLDLVRNRPAFRAFLDALPASERGGLLTAGGEPSLSGLRRLEAATIARAYGDADLVARLTESPDDNIKAIGGALRDVAPQWARMRQAANGREIIPSMDATADLMAAVRTVMEARNRGRPVDEMLAQGDLLGGGLTDNGRAFLSVMFSDPGFRRAAGRARVAERLQGYVDEAMKSQPGPNLFGEAPPSPADVLGAITGRRAQMAETVDVANPDAEIDALVADAERVLAETDMELAVATEVVDGEEVAVTRSARELFEEAEADRRLAEEIRDCAGVGALQAAE